MKELKAQLIGALMVILTVAAAICAVLNWQQLKRFPLPYDGVIWMDQATNHPDPHDPSQPRKVVVAVHVMKSGPGDRAGIVPGDVLQRIGGIPIEHSLQVPQVLQEIGVNERPLYLVNRAGYDVTPKVYITRAPQDNALYMQYLVGAGYLIIGLFIYFRRGRAPRSLHFFLLCLTSFIYHSFHYTGKLNAFDSAIYLGNLVAGLLAPALFLHFCCVFPEPPRRWSPARLVSIYAPVLSLLALQVGVAVGVVRTALPLVELNWLLDRVWMIVFAGFYIAGAVVLHQRYRAMDDPIIRQQLKWLRNGTVFGIVPFTLLYVIPYSLAMVPSPEARLVVLSLGLIPLAWAYAILRYRLMDVDIIFQQGYVYVLATLSVLGVVYALVLVLQRREELSASAVILLVLVAALIFEPLRGWIQQQLDRYVFYRDRYDYRRTLISFAREMSSEMDLDRSLRSVADKLLGTLSLNHLAFFLDETGQGRFRLHALVERKQDGDPLEGSELDLSFLTATPAAPYLFFERTRHLLDVVSREWAPSVRATIARLDLTYYFPCTYRGRTLAWLGVGRTAKGDFLSSEDVELLASLSGYIALSVENARLYRSLADKVEEVERLKEFSENIVESINVGILAAALDQRVESWNTQMERLTGIPRWRAVGRRLDELFPPDLMVHLASNGASEGVHQMYKVPFRPHRLAAHGDGNGNGDTAAVAGERVVNLATTPLVAKDGRQIGRLILFDDITAREDLERRLVQADRMSSIGVLAAGVAHEVNTPLAVISSYAQMLAKQVAGDDQKAKILDKIAKQTFRASEIVNSLLNFSRTNSTAFEELDLNRIVRETCSLVEHQFDKQGVRIESSLDTGLPRLRGNAGKLQQVLLNLLLNARDAMEGGGTVHLRTFVEDAQVCLEVKDTGHGIPREVLPRIFDPFFTTKTGKKGTGLGLSISYGIVEEHGGVIEAGSEPGQGASFRLSFPAVRKPVHV